MSLKIKKLINTSKRNWIEENKETGEFFDGKCHLKSILGCFGLWIGKKHIMQMIEIISNYFA